MLRLLKERNFSLFWIGNLISSIGDHVSIIAFPWLVLTLTNSPALMGLVFAAQGIPRAIFMLGGGAIVDRFSPRNVMIICNLVRLLIVSFLCWLLMYDAISVTQVFLFAIAFGFADAFYFPAANAIIPSLVETADLKDGNALVQMAIQLSVIIGPAIGGFLIAGEFNFGTAHEPVPTDSQTDEITSDQQGLANAFLFDAVTFFVSWVSLLLIKTRALHKHDEASVSIIESVKEGLVFVWRAPALRLVFFGIMCLDFFFMAPIFVGLPVLAKSRFEEGALVYAMELMAYGVGALLGGLLAGFTRGPSNKNLVRTAFFLWAFSGIVVFSMVFFYSVTPPMILFGLSGFGDSWVWIFLMTWIQKITPEKMLGRVMSILMFLSVGMVPIANMLVGMLLEWNIEAVFVIAGLSVASISLICAFHPDGKKMDVVGQV